MDGLAAAGVLARLLQYSAAAAGGTALFLTYGWRPAGPRRWRRGLAAMFALGTLATVAWLMIQAGLFGMPSDAFDPAQVWSVAVDTGFGRAALARALLFALAAAAAATGRWGATAAVAALATAGFAFGGHAAGDEGLARPIHQAADIAHLLSAAIWLGALPPLLILLRRAPAADARTALDRFSAIGPAVVAVLALSGAVNAWLIVGPQPVGTILASPYGRVLAVKLALFALMLALAAANRWRLAPRLGGETTPAATRELTRSLWLENVFGLGVLALVGLLGTLPPPGA